MVPKRQFFWIELCACHLSFISPSISHPVSHVTSLCRKRIRLWYQAYLLKQRGITVRLIERAKCADCQAIFLAVDSVRFDYREKPMREMGLILMPCLSCQLKKLVMVARTRKQEIFPR